MPYALAAMMLFGTTALQEGSVVVFEHSNKPVARFTGSAVTHVALISHLAGEPYVYEATPAKVRRLPWTEYVEEVAMLNRGRKTPMRLWILEPRKTYSARQVFELQRYYHSQLGRRYSVKGYVRGRKGDGVHCAEFAASALTKTGRFEFEHPEKISPASLAGQLQPLYLAPQRVKVPSTTAPRPSWSVRVWQRMTSFRAWCTWACFEMWTFCL